MDRTSRKRVALLCIVGVVVPVTGTVTVLLGHAAAAGRGRESAEPLLAQAERPDVIAIIAALVAAAHLGGVLAVWLRQPRVVGQIAVGLVLGPSVLGRLAPDAAIWLSGASSDSVIGTLANLGVIMFAFGAARELAEDGQRGGFRTFAVGQATVAIPLLAGVGVAITALGSRRPDGVEPVAYTLFVGLAMSATALPVLAHILSERHLLTSRVGALAVTSAAFGDASIWGVLAVTLCLSDSRSSVNVLLRLGAAVGLAGVIWWGVRPLLRRVLTAGRDSMYVGPALLLCGLLLCAYLTDALGLHAVFGAFLFGLAVPKGSPSVRRIAVSADGLTQLLLLPLFFTAAGARADLNFIAHPDIFGILVLIVAVAVASKVASASWAGRMVDMSLRESVALGVMMNCRGVTELVILNVGLTAGLIDETTFTAFLVMALVTTAATGPMLSLLGFRSLNKDPNPEDIGAAGYGVTAQAISARQVGF